MQNNKKLRLASKAMLGCALCCLSAPSVKIDAKDTLDAVKVSDYKHISLMVDFLKEEGLYFSLENVANNINNNTENGNEEETNNVITYTKKYATANVNIRTEPSIKSKSLHVLSFRSSIKTIENLSNGWTKVMYKGQECYIFSKYLNKKRPKKTVEDLGNYVEYTAPSKSTFKSYEPEHLITMNNSIPQGALHRKYVTDYRTGISTVNGRYCLAIGSGFHIKVGDYVDLIMESGLIAKCIIADTKADKDTDSSNRVHLSDGSFCEFIVNVSALPSIVKKMGDVSYATKELKGKVKTLRIYEN